MIINRSEHQTLLLASGEILTVVADAYSSGSVNRLNDSVLSAVVAGETKTFGPFTTPKNFDVVCVTGFLTYSTAPVDLTALSLGADSLIAADPAYGDSSSFQPIAGDLELEAGVGTSDAGDTAFLAPIMGNVHGDALTKTHNYVGGVIGADSVTGTQATTLQKGPVLGVVMDGVTQADGAVVAVIDGSDPSSVTRANAAFAARMNNNNAGSGVDYGVDLYDAGRDSSLYSGGGKPLAVAKAEVRCSNGLWIVALAVAITANVTTTTAPAGSIGFTSHATGRGKLFVSDGAKWQYAAVS